MKSDSCTGKYTLPDGSDPYNALLLGKSGMMIEPYDEHSFTELKKHYSALIDEKNDASCFILEGMSLAADLRGALIECKKRKKPVFAIIDVDDELLTEAELPADAALIILQSMGLSGFGICTEDEETLIDGMDRLAKIAKIPLLAKLKYGIISAETRAVLEEKGFEIISDENGMMCIPPEENETALLLANEREAFFLEPDTTEISEAIECSEGMEEEIFSLSHEAYDVLKIQLETPEDAITFAEHAHMTSLPVMFSTENEISLMLALMLYQGRALVDSTCELDERTLKKAVEKYGAVIY